MDIKEAIAHAKEQKEIFGGTHKEFLNIAIEALEKQIPMKIVNRGDEHNKYGHCKCEAFAVDIHKYCPKCGQAMDWSEEE